MNLGFRDFVEQVRGRSDLTEVIGTDVELRPSGSTLKALSPFHPEKSPSFVVWPATRLPCVRAGLLHHSDQGSTYASEDYQDLLRENGIACSMSRRGNCLDNAAMESWNSTVKAELGETFESIARGKEQLFDYIEVFYNQRRRHSALDYVSPARYEREQVTEVQMAA